MEKQKDLTSFQLSCQKNKMFAVLTLQCILEHFNALKLASKVGLVLMSYAKSRSSNIIHLCELENFNSNP